MNIFKISYKVVRRNSNELYKGFGFKHLSDATMYYVHPNNQSVNNTTTLCQPIGEAVILFSLLLSSITKGVNNVPGDFYISQNKRELYLEINVPNDYRLNEVVEDNIYKYKIFISNKNISIGAYDQYNNWIEGNMEHLHPLYKLLPAFLGLLAMEFETNADFRKLFLEYIEDPAVDEFVNIHEDFYQNHKFDSYELDYLDINNISLDNMDSFSSKFDIIRENVEERNVTEKVNIIKFPNDTFKNEYTGLIPNLSSEFELSKDLRPLCNAITEGDARAILFHGPSGTGKTMACKLIAKEIGMPIMEIINCTENLDEFVLGKYIPEDEKIIFKESYVTKAIRYGGAVVFEEINFAKPQYLAFLNSLLDDNGFVRLDNGETVYRNENFRFFATLNMGYFGTKELNQALYNRFNCIFEIGSLADEAIKKMLIYRVPECENVVDKIINVYHKIKKKIEKEELEIVISPRNLENWARLAKYEGYIKGAEKTIIPIAKCDRALEEAIRGIIVLYKWS